MTKDHILRALYKGNLMQSELPKPIIDLPGFCPPKIRHFLNNLCDFTGCNYLEVGTYQGASLLSAAHGHYGIFTGIDDFSEFDSPRDALYKHIEMYSGESQVRFVENDCWEVDLKKLTKNVNVYLYDGSHDYDSQRRGLIHFQPILSDQFVLLVDDYSWDDSIRGTHDALKELNYKIDMKVELHDDGNQQGWWNGLLVLLASKGV